MSQQYRALCPFVSSSEADEFGRWLGKYAVEISGLAVWQIGASGKRYKDDPLADTITQTARSFATSAVTAQVGAPVLIPLVGLIPWIAIPALIASLPGLIFTQHKLRKRLPPDAARGDEIVATELEFSLSGVSAKRRRWSEYLLSIYGALHAWTKIDGMTHPEQWPLGAAYAARTGSYPRPWSEQPPRSAHHPPKIGATTRGAQSRASKPRTSRQTIGAARRLWWRITDEL